MARATWSSKQDQEQGLSLTGLNPAVVRLVTLEVTARMLHGETPSEAMQNGFDDMQISGLDSVTLPGAATPEQETAASLLVALPRLSGALSLVNVDAAVALPGPGLEESLMGLERDSKANGRSNAAVIRLSNGEVLGLYLSFIDSDLPVFPVLFDPQSRSAHSSASCMYFDSGIEVASYLTGLIEEISKRGAAPIDKFEILSLAPLGSGVTGDLTTENDMIEALGWPRPLEVEVLRSPTPTAMLLLSPREYEKEPMSAATTVEDEEVKHGTLRPMPSMGDSDLVPEEPVFEGIESERHLCGFCGYNWGSR